MRTYAVKSLLCDIACFVKCFFFFFEKRRYFDRVVTVDGVFNINIDIDVEKVILICLMLLNLLA